MRRFNYSYIFPVAFIAVLGCSDRGKPIMIVLPDNYRGEFRIVKDSHKGTKLVQENDWWVFAIPDDGTLYVTEDWPFYKWHGFTVRYRNGRTVATEDLGTQAGQRQNGPGSSRASTEFDGTTHTWRTIGDP